MSATTKSKPPPILTNMPWNIKKDIIDSTDTQTKFSLRRCSKELKTITDKSPMFHESLQFDWAFNCKCIRIQRFVINGWDKGSAVDFTKKPKGYIRIEELRGLWDRNNQKKVEEGSFIDAAIEQFMKLLRCPNTRLGTLSIKLSNVENDSRGQAQKKEIFRKLVAALGTLEWKIQTKSLWMTNHHSQDDILQILPFLSLETFKGFCLSRDDRPRGLNIDLTEISATEHWKQARKLTINNYYMTLPREAIEHFSSASYHLETFTVDDAEFIISKFLRPNGWKSHYVKCDTNMFTVLVPYLSKIDNMRKFKDDDSMMFGIRKGEFNCRVVVSESSNQIGFEECSERTRTPGYREI